MAEKSGEVIPALQTKVTAKPHLIYIWHAFDQLSTERGVSFGPGPIPVVSAIERYARDRGIGHVDRFVHLVRSMDTAWILHLKNRAEGAATPAP